MLSNEERKNLQVGDVIISDRNRALPMANNYVVKEGEKFPIVGFSKPRPGGIPAYPLISVPGNESYMIGIYHWSLFEKKKKVFEDKDYKEAFV